jgi:VWFA-related protein
MSFEGVAMRGLCLLAVVLMLGGTAAAQTAEPQTSTLTVQSNLVLVPVLVQDSKRNVLYGLKAAQFVVKDNGIEQTVRVEDSEEASALSLVVVVQCSRSAEMQQDNLRGLATMVDAISGEAEQETAVVSFGTEPQLLGGFSADPDTTHAVVKKYQPCDDDGGASIYDAVNYAAKLLETRNPHRLRAILLISETRDHGSETRARDVIERLGKSNIVVDAVTFSPGKSAVIEDLKHSDGAAGGPIGMILMAVQAVRKNAPKEFARMSGGEYINFTTQKGFDRSLGGLANHVHNGYLLSFQPHGDTSPGLHKITVGVPDYKSTVRHRESYWYGDVAVAK